MASCQSLVSGCPENRDSQSDICPILGGSPRTVSRARMHRLAIPRARVRAPYPNEKRPGLRGGGTGRRAHRGAVLFSHAIPRPCGPQAGQLTLHTPACNALKQGAGARAAGMALWRGLPAIGPANATSHRRMGGGAHRSGGARSGQTRSIRMRCPAWQLGQVRELCHTRDSASDAMSGRRRA